MVDKQIAEADETKFRDNSDNKDVPLRLLICVLADPREKRDVGLLGEMIGQAKKYHLDRGGKLKGLAMDVPRGTVLRRSSPDA